MLRVANGRAASASTSNAVWEESFMHKITSMLVGMCAVLALGAHAHAQAPAAPPSAGGTPDKMPFNIPYGPSVTLAQAKQAAAAAVAEAHKGQRDWNMAVSVVDPAGELVYFEKMDSTAIASVAISQRKARAAARYRRETRAFYNAFEAGHPYLGTLASDLVASPGGFPLIADGKIIGAIGCSGGVGDQDAATCKAGVDTIK
jgi:uncharacterized protein GlcG (DUF336 family)